MLRDPSAKYRPFAPIGLADRSWPNRVITAPPTWCSVDLRDGNQALIEPMDAARKRRMFDMLVKIGFKEIEVGFPAASQTDFDFVRELIERRLIPDDVVIQVLTQARPELIARTYESLRVRGAPSCMFTTQPRWPSAAWCFAPIGRGSSTSRSAAPPRCANMPCASADTDWTFEYSPESFTGTELDFAVEVCDAVNAVWEPTAATQLDSQSSGNGRNGDTEYLCRSNRMVLCGTSSTATPSS